MAPRQLCSFLHSECFSASTFSCRQNIREDARGHIQLHRVINMCTVCVRLGPGVPGCSHHSSHLGLYYISHRGVDRKASLLIKSSFRLKMECRLLRWVCIFKGRCCQFTRTESFNWGTQQSASAEWSTASHSLYWII